MQTQQMGKELLCAIWFLVVAGTFIASAQRIALPMGALTALYSIILMGGAVVLVLPIAHQKGKNDRVE
jgi:hypothetical protein